jgi:TRAP-type transport system small permease protein
MSPVPVADLGEPAVAVANSGLLSAIERMDLALTSGLRWVLIGLLSGMALIVFTNVVLRYATNGSLVWAEEVARYAMVWLTLLGAGPVFRAGGHIAIENLQDALPKPLAQSLRAAILLAVCGLSIGMVIMGLQYMQRAQYQLTPSTQVSFAYVYAAMPVGGALLLWSTVAMGAGYVRERRFEPDAATSGHEEGVQV